jgi:hypothetical protein
MMNASFSRYLPILLPLLLTGCSDDAATPPLATGSNTSAAASDVGQSPEPKAGAAPPMAEAAEPGASTVREIEWDALIPDGYQPDKLLQEYQADDLADDDPRAAELSAKLRELWDQAPVREDLDGAAVKLPGFVVPVEGDAEQTTSFLLVPYYGACIHVPPPPANQTVYVLTEPGKGIEPGLFDVVWVTGTMSVKRTENDIAESGYTLYATDVVPYE